MTLTDYHNYSDSNENQLFYYVLIYWKKENQDQYIYQQYISDTAVLQATKTLFKTN